MNNIDLLKNIIKQLEQWCVSGIISDLVKEIMTIQLNKAIKELEVGKLYKEYSDLQFEIIVNFSNHLNFVRGEEIQRELNEIAKKINELLHE